MILTALLESESASQFNEPVIPYSAWLILLFLISFFFYWIVLGITEAVRNC